MNEPDSTAPAAMDRGRPPRDSRVEAAAHAGIWESLLRQNVFGFAGDDPDPRPLPRRTLYTIKKKMSDYLQANRNTSEGRSENGRPWAWDTLHFALCHDRVRMPLHEVIPVSREDLWWLIAPDDLVLLSDRVTHHYTTVDHVAREVDRVFFIDEWPDRVFLQAGMNAAGVAAEVSPYMAGVLDPVAPVLKGKLHVSISRDEFLKVVVGLITLDTPGLLDRFLAHRPAARTSYAVRFAMGAALIDPGMDRLARFAVGHFKAAWQIATERPEAGDRARAAACLYHSLVIARWAQQFDGEALAAKPFADELQHLLEKEPEEDLLSRLDTEELARLGNAAGHAQEFATAMSYLDRAVASDPSHEGARHLRAMARSRTSDWAGVVDDLTAALAANTRRQEDRQAQRTARDPRDRYGISDDEARLGGLRHRRVEQLQLLASACVECGNPTGARDALTEMIALEPDSAEGHRLLGALAFREGRIEETRKHLSTAKGFEKTARGRAQIDQALAALASGAAANPSQGATSPATDVGRAIDGGNPEVRE